ncbi:MAG: hypothetical protein IKA12_05295 [Clostridia bacterium]|nr:hypothetical protein [Clostridia bacterium]
MEKTKKLVVLKIIISVLYVLINALLLWEYLDIVSITDATNKGLSLAVYLVIIVLIIGNIGNLAAVTLSVIGLIISVAKGYGKGNVVFFVLGIVLPVLTEALFILLCALAN